MGAACRFDCLGFHTTITLHRRLIGLSVRLRDRRQTRTPYRDRPVRHLSFWLRDFHLHCRLRGGEPGVGSIYAGLYGQRHLDGV
jgi:hypothetical protein